MYKSQSFELFPTVVQRFDLREDITDLDRQSLIHDIDHMIDKELHLQINELTPKYQSLPVLFNDRFEYISRSHWRKLRDSFYQCCGQYLESTPNFCQNQGNLQPTWVRAWFYKSDAVINQDQSNPSHNHAPALLTGVFYIHVPGDGNTGGTELIDPRGPGQRGTRMCEITPINLTWLIFPGWMDHRSVWVDVQESRYVVAADCYVRVT
jgi:hypothetical protein